MASAPDTAVVTGPDLAQVSIGSTYVTVTGTQNTLVHWLGNGSVTLAALTAVIAALPTTAPGTPGVLWLNGGVLELSS